MKSIALLALLFVAAGSNEIQPRHNDEVPVMIQREGYPCEVHPVTTVDGYVLQMHRIPWGKNSPPGTKKTPVLLQHGLLCSSADWVMGIPEKFLGYILADAGYDVWLGNYRGNHYSRDHLVFDPDQDNDFWEFSWDQMGRLDLPAQIDHILEWTQVSQIHYAGHSMGTTGFMVMMSERPDMEDKIIMANLLAPVAYMEHMESPIRLLAGFAQDAEWIASHLGDGEFLPGNAVMDWLGEHICQADWGEIICENVLFMLCGFDPAQVNDTLLPTIVSHSPAGTSTYTVLQYGQEYDSHQFCHYDHYGNNNDYYGQPQPPLYTPSSINVPISLYWSDNDWMANPQDVLRLEGELPNVYDSYRVPYENWNHLDYLWGIDAPTLVYSKVLENMAKAEEELGKNKN